MKNHYQKQRQGSTDHLVVSTDLSVHFRFFLHCGTPEKQNKMQLRFLKMLRENESKFQTLRVSVPRQIRENIWKNKKSKEMKLSMEREIDIIFGVDPSSGLTMVKEVISTDVSSL